jgi:hypothetical protein
MLKNSVSYSLMWKDVQIFFLFFSVNIWLHLVFFFFFGKWISNVKKLQFLILFLVPV